MSTASALADGNGCFCNVGASSAASYHSLVSCVPQLEAATTSAREIGGEERTTRDILGGRSLGNEEKSLKRKKPDSDGDQGESPPPKFPGSVYEVIVNQMATVGMGAAEGQEDVHLQTAAADVLRIAKLVSAALFAYNQDDLERSFPEDWHYDTRDIDLLLTAADRLKQAYRVAGEGGCGAQRYFRTATL